MILVCTPTGHTGRHALAGVLAAGADARVLVRDAARLPEGVADHCEVIEGDGRDPDALDRATRDVAVAFYCTPQSPNPPDLNDYYRSFVEPFAAACRSNDVQRVVTISGGDEEPDLSGPGAALRMSEDILNDVVHHARHIRCGYFMENLLWQVPALAFRGTFSLPVPAHLPLPFVAAADIGYAAAGLLVDPEWSGHVPVEAYGPVGGHPCSLAAAIVGGALNRSIRFEVADPDEWTKDMITSGLSPAMAEALAEMFGAIEAGRDMGGVPSRPVACPTTLADWADAVLKPAVTAALADPPGAAAG